MRQIKKEDQKVFKMMCAYLKTGQRPMARMYELAKKYEIDLDKLQDSLLGESGEYWMTQVTERAFA